VRQLANALARAQIMSDDLVIRAADLPRDVVASPHVRPKPPAPGTEGDHLAEVQRAHILDVLKREHGNKARTARALGVNRRSLYRLLEKYNIQLDEPAGAPSQASAPTDGR
jgi:DNA-binding NtrC family response regulator